MAIPIWNGAMMVLGLTCCTMACPIEHNFKSLCLEVNNFVRKYVKVEGMIIQFHWL